jgi:hypothetical protein
MDPTKIAILSSIIGIVGIGIYTLTGKTSSNTHDIIRPSLESVSSSIFNSDSSDNDDNERISTVSISSNFSNDSNIKGGKLKGGKRKKTKKRKSKSKTKKIKNTRKTKR